ncbi:MAG: hypothetical protein U7126_09995 [Microcoleus sp.]
MEYKTVGLFVHWFSEAIGRYGERGQFTTTERLGTAERKIRLIFDHLLSIGQLSAIPIFAKHIAA